MSIIHKSLSTLPTRTRPPPPIQIKTRTVRNTLQEREEAVSAWNVSSTDLCVCF